MTVTASILEVFIGGLILVSYPAPTTPPAPPQPVVAWIPTTGHQATLQWADAEARCTSTTQCPYHEIGDRGLILLGAGTEITVTAGSAGESVRVPANLSPTPGPDSRDGWGHVLPVDWILPPNATLAPNSQKSIKVVLPHGALSSRGYPEAAGSGESPGLAKWSYDGRERPVADEIVLSALGVNFTVAGTGGWTFELTGVAGRTPSLRLRNFMHESSDRTAVSELSHNKMLCPLFKGPDGQNLEPTACGTPKLELNRTLYQYRPGRFPGITSTEDARTKTTGFCPPACSPC